MGLIRSKFGYLAVAVVIQGLAAFSEPASAETSQQPSPPTVNQAEPPRQPKAAPPANDQPDPPSPRAAAAAAHAAATLREEQALIGGETYISTTTSSDIETVGDVPAVGEPVTSGNQRKASAQITCIAGCR